MMQNYVKQTYGTMIRKNITIIVRYHISFFTKMHH